MWTSVILALVVVAIAVLYNFLQPRFDPKMMAGKRVIVTGASMGIGEQLAYELAKMKAHVVIVARSADKMEKIVKKCKELGAASANYLSVDLSTKDETVLHKVIDDSVKILDGKLDMLVLNHLSPGTVIMQKFWPDSFTKFGLSWLVDQFHLNVFSYFVLSNHAMPILERNHGKLVVISSVSGVLGIGKTLGYSAQKHALHGYFNGLRANLADHKRNNMTITLCILGAIDTDTLQSNTGVSSSFLLKPAPADDCARNIIAGGQMGERTVYYPYGSVRPATMLAPFVPRLLEVLTDFILGSD